MMIFSHALLGGITGMIALLVAPGQLETAIWAGMIGGLVPDMDMLLDHRRSLHFPVFGTISMLLFLASVLLLPSEVILVCAAFVTGMVFHSLTDILGEGRVMRHWKDKDHRAAYDHLRKQWITPRRLIKTGDPEDLFIAAVSAFIIVSVVQGLLSVVTTLLVIGALVFTIMFRPAAAYVSEDHQSIEAWIKHHLASIWPRS